MRIWLLALVLGSIAIVGSITAYIYTRNYHERDLQDIARMHDQLESTRAALATATTAADSARLADDIEAREQGIGRRVYHVPRRQARLDGWWRSTAPGTLSVAVGGVLIMVGLALRWRGKAAAA